MLHEMVPDRTAFGGLLTFRAVGTRLSRPRQEYLEENRTSRRTTTDTLGTSAGSTSSSSSNVKSDRSSRPFSVVRTRRPGAVFAFFFEPSFRFGDSGSSLFEPDVCERRGGATM